MQLFYSHFSISSSLMMNSEELLNTESRFERLAGVLMLGDQIHPSKMTMLKLMLAAKAITCLGLLEAQAF